MASAVAEAVIYLLVMQWALPAVQTRVTPRTSRVASGRHEGPRLGGALCHCGDRCNVGSASACGFPLGVWSHGWEETDYTRWVTLR